MNEPKDPPVSQGGTGGTGGSSGSQDPLRTTCDASTETCTCSTTRDASAPSDDCSKSSFPETTCCASTGWPDTEGSSCECSSGQAGVCYISEDKESCGCAAGERPLWATDWTPDLSCKNLAPMPSFPGDVLRCCMLADESLCACSWTSFSCELNYDDVNGEPAHEVDSCTFSDVAEGCADGSREVVASCSNPSATGTGGSGNGTGGSATAGTGGGVKASCQGSPDACDSHANTSDCGRVTGCSWSGCSGTAKSCGSYVGSAACEQQAGCSYSGLFPNGSCGGSAESCSSLDDDESDCGRQTGCTWDGCQGTAAPCSTKTDPNSCATQYGCHWQE